MKKTGYVFLGLICFYLVLECLSFSKLGQESNPIIIGINEWTGYDPLILADQLSLFEKNDVYVDIIRCKSAKDEMDSFTKNQFHGAGFTLDEVFSLISSGFKGKVVLIIDFSMGGDMVIGQPYIKSMSDLVGKTIGYEGSVVGEFLLNRALQMNQVKKSSVKLNDVQANDWLSIFKEKKVDALVCFNPVASILLDNERGNLLFSSAEIPFEIVDVLFFSESFFTNNKLAITKIIKTWFDALHYINSNLDQSAQIIASVKKISAHDYKNGLTDLKAPDIKLNRSLFNPESEKNIFKYSQVIINFMIDRGLLSKRIHTTDLFLSELLSEVEDINYQGR